MSFKENMEMVRDELNSEEKFFEQAVKTERLLKKYQKPLIAAAVAFLLIIVGYVSYNAYMENRIENANEAYNVLINDPENRDAANELNSLNPELYDAWLLSVAIKGHDIEALEKLTGSKAPVVSDIASYQVAVLKKDASALGGYSYTQDAIYRDMAIIEESVLLMESNQVEQAHQKLSTIAQDSPVYKIAQLLKHYGVK
ncbi:MAG: hypothetical protein B5M52_01210 [Helicobacteraceae bacterium 4484_230]|nr:MAG: hypothetical protein B5M52_01210 [Helicobacteraceae bacterium 4484_230]